MFTDGELGINVYGFSYHLDQSLAKEIGTDNQLNPGLGLRYEFAKWNRWSFFADAGVYEDSGRNTAVSIGTGALWHFDGGFRAGAALALFDSKTYNASHPFIVPLPIAAYDIGPVTLNATFFPKISQYNDIATLAFWVTFWPKRW